MIHGLYQRSGFPTLIEFTLYIQNVLTVIICGEGGGGGGCAYELTDTEFFAGKSDDISMNNFTPNKGVS